MDQYRFPQSQTPYSQNTQGQGFTPPPQPSFSGPDMAGSVQKVLGNNVGQYVVMEFLIGTQSIVRKQGILYFVGTDYVVLYDDVLENYIVCDLYAIKFTYFYYPGQRPGRNFNALTPIDFEGKQ